MVLGFHHYARSLRNFYNLTQNTCETGKYDEFIEDAVDYISDKYKDIYVQTFQRDTLIKKFWNGQTKVSLEHVFYQKKKERCFLQTTVEMVENSYTGDIEAVLYGFDITQEYISRKLPELLYQSEFESVSIIDAPNHTYTLQKFDMVNDLEKNTFVDYDTQKDVFYTFSHSSNTAYTEFGVPGVSAKRRRFGTSASHIGQIQPCASDRTGNGQYTENHCFLQVNGLPGNVGDRMLRFYEGIRYVTKNRKINHPPCCCG